MGLLSSYPSELKKTKQNKTKKSQLLCWFLFHPFHSKFNIFILCHIIALIWAPKLWLKLCLFLNFETLCTEHEEEVEYAVKAV